MPKAGRGSQVQAPTAGEGADRGQGQEGGRDPRDGRKTARGV